MEEAAKPSARGMPSLDSGYSWFVVVMLMLSYALSYIDRQMLSLLVDPIKRSLVLSDTQFSFVQGSAFVLAYIGASPLIGRLVDKYNRRNLLICGILTWSTFTVLGGFATSYVELFLTRVGVGFAEACVFPLSLSLIGDYFSPKKMARAMSIFTLGSQLGSGFSLVCSGLVVAFAATLTTTIPILASLETWQMVLVVIGCPGAAFSLVVLLIREPRRERGVEPSRDREMSLGEVLVVFKRRRSFYIRIYGTIGAFATISLGQAAWYPAFLMRVHGMDAPSVGLVFGASAVILGTLSNLAGPAIAAPLQRRGYVDAYLRIAAYCTPGLLVGALLIPLWSTATGAFVSAWIILIFSSLPLGLIAGATQNATPPRMRGIVGAFYTFVAQIFGYMTSPFLIALITDHVFANERMVGYSMQIVMSLAALVAAYLMFTSFPHYVAVVREDHSEPV